jgi:hypothetical protein
MGGKSFLKSLLGLIRALIARPAKKTPQNIHWVKAQKPFGEMTPEERVKFSEKLAQSMEKQINKLK